MGLDAFQAEAALAYLREIRAWESVCPACRGETWGIGDVVAVPSLIDGGLAVDGRGPVIGLLLVECGTCGYVRTFNAARVPGLMPGSSPG